MIGFEIAYPELDRGGNVSTHLRKIIKARGHFPSDDAVTKLIWLALRNVAAG
ncbi:protein of unknown function [Ralstonia solanacearum CFBP2957]|nr:protein of unknown function [Ralstonia solanacearum CFBP2957]